MIGVFDSGVGGLGVVAEIRLLMPTADILYFADQGRAPYGERTLDEVAAMAEQVTGWLLERGAEPIVVACNTASAAALHTLRSHHPATTFVGMEPAVKPAANATSSGVIGVLATAATFQAELFSSLIERHANDTTVLTSACPRWVDLVERGVVDGPVAEAAVARCLHPLIEGGADVLVLGCTHFTFLTPLIRSVAGEGITVVDPAPAVARQVQRVCPHPTGSGHIALATSGSPSALTVLAGQLAGIESDVPLLAWSWNDT